MYKTCQGKPPDGQCRMDHNHPEMYNETHLRHMMMSLDEARAKREESSWRNDKKAKGKGKDKDKQSNNDNGEEAIDNGQGHNADGEEWWKNYCNHCQTTGHTTKSCPHNPHWNKRCDVCNHVGHIKNSCRASEATIARGMQQKAEYESRLGGNDGGKGRKARKGKKGIGDGGDKGKADGGAAGLDAAGGGAAAVPDT